MLTATCVLHLQELAGHISELRTTVNAEMSVWVDEVRDAKAKAQAAASAANPKGKGKGKGTGKRKGKGGAKDSAQKKPCTDQ